MPLEIEAKYRLRDVQALRRRLAELGAEPLGAVTEDNTFYDTAGGDLARGHCGLRIRVLSGPGAGRAIMTYKGPRRPGPLKTRQEEQMPLDDPEAAQRILSSLGYRPTLHFQKRRESYRLGPARVELDELPELGFFTEIEADDEAAVYEAARRLGLADDDMVSHAYTHLIAKHLGRRGGGMELLFAES